MLARIEGVFQEEIKVANNRQGRMNELDGKEYTFLLPVTIGTCGRLSILKDRHTIDVGECEGVSALVLSIQEDWKRRSLAKAQRRESS